MSALSSNDFEHGLPNLIVGCGYLGLRVARAWVAKGRRVAALTRGSRQQEFASLGIVPVIGDVLDPASLTSLPPSRTLLYAVGYDRSVKGPTMRDVYVRGLAHVLTALPAVERIIYISSTSVYGQTDGSIVDESSLTEPIEESGRIVLEAEETLRAARPDAIILRFSGIYGPNRLLREQAIRAGMPLAGDAEKWLNLIHVSDGVRAVLAAEAHAAPGTTYNIADDTPMTRRQYYTKLAELLGAPTALFEPAPHGSKPARDTHRRISNQRARIELGFEPEYPSSFLGLAASVDH